MQQSGSTTKRKTWPDQQFINQRTKERRSILLPLLFSDDIPYPLKFIISIQTMQSANKDAFLPESFSSNKTALKPQPAKPLNLSSQSADLSTLDLSKSYLEVRRKVKQQLNFEFYFIDYDNTSKKYQLVKSKPSSSSPFLKEITELILSSSRFHIKHASCSQISNFYFQSPPKVMKPLIIPVFDGKQFAFVFETTACRRTSLTECEFSDRFLVFMTESFLPYTLGQLAKNLTKQEFEDRWMQKFSPAKEDQYENPTNLTSRVSLMQQLSSYAQLSRKFYFSKEKDLAQQKDKQLKWYLRNITDYNILIRLSTLHYHPILLLSLLIYYAIREYKIVLIGSKQNRHIMSQAAFALKTALSPIDYCYPIVFSAISDYNDNFIDSPVPCFICYWGDQLDCMRMKNRFKRVNEEGLMPSALIDLNTLTSFNSIPSESQSISLRRMNNYIINNKSGQNAVQRANSYVFSELLQGQNDDLKQQSTILRNSLSYQVYKQDRV